MPPSSSLNGILVPDSTGSIEPKALERSGTFLLINDVRHVKIQKIVLSQQVCVCVAVHPCMFTDMEQISSQCSFGVRDQPFVEANSPWNLNETNFFCAQSVLVEEMRNAVTQMVRLSTMVHINESDKLAPDLVKMSTQVSSLAPDVVQP